MTAPTKQRTLEDLRKLHADNMTVALALIARDWETAAEYSQHAFWGYDWVRKMKTAWDNNMPYPELNDLGDFALRDLLATYPGLRALCVELPEGMTEEWEEDVE